MTPAKPLSTQRLGKSSGQERVIAARLAPVPTRGTPQRTIRVSDEMWKPFAEACKKQGKTPSEVVRDCIRAYLDEHGGPNGGQGVTSDDTEH